MWTVGYRKSEILSKVRATDTDLVVTGVQVILKTLKLDEITHRKKNILLGIKRGPKNVLQKPLAPRDHLSSREEEPAKGAEKE